MKRGTIIALAAGAAALLVGGLIVWWVVTRPPTIEAAATSYLDALSRGDADSIEAMVGTGDPDVLETALAALEGADSYVADPHLDEVGDDGSVRATVRLDGEDTTVFFILGLEDGAWRLTGDYLATVTVTPSLGDAVFIGDALAPAGTVGLFPAVYSVNAAPRGVLDGSTSIAVTNADPLDVSLDAAVSEGAAALAQPQVDAYADSCAETAPAVPDNCGLLIPWAADLAALEEVAYRIDQHPVVQIAGDARSFTAADGVIIATATGVTADGAPASFTYRTFGWTLRGTVQLTGDQMVLSVR